MTQHRRYTDEFRAQAVAAAIAAGYPQQKGALSRVAREFKIDHPLLRSWIIGSVNPPPKKLLQEKKDDLRSLLQDELNNILQAMPGKRGEASYAQMGSVFGILFDKIRLLDGLPTEIVHILPGLLAAIEGKGLKASDVFGALLQQLNESEVPTNE